VNGGVATLWLAALAAACGRSSVSPTNVAASAPPAWQVRALGGQRPIETGTAEPSLVDADACRGCHAEQHHEWASSRHGTAWTNGIFQREYAEEPRAWCVNCHAPLTVQQAGLAAGDGRLAEQGVNCAACHVRAGALVSSQRAKTSPHATVVDPSFASPAMCADCHQFTFPVLRPSDGQAIAMTRFPMQSTVADFFAGPYADSPDDCATCHATRYGHGYPGGHDLGMLRGAVQASWCRTDAAVVISIANVGAGHRVPTGDIHRHMLARVWRSSAPESTFEAYFGRRFRPVDGGGKEIIWDSTLAPGERRRFDVAERSLSAPAEAAGDAVRDEGPSNEPINEPIDEPINFEVTYVYTIDEFPRRDRRPSEPVTAQLTVDRRPFASIPRCPPDRQPTTSGGSPPSPP
jgi:Cytochrome c554 and c-prime